MCFFQITGRDNRTLKSPARKNLSGNHYSPSGSRTENGTGGADMAAGRFPDVRSALPDSRSARPNARSACPHTRSASPDAMSAPPRVRSARPDAKSTRQDAGSARPDAKSAPPMVRPRPDPASEARISTLIPSLSFRLGSLFRFRERASFLYRPVLGLDLFDFFLRQAEPLGQFLSAIPAVLVLAAVEEAFAERAVHFVEICGSFLCQDSV